MTLLSLLYLVTYIVRETRLDASRYSVIWMMKYAPETDDADMAVTC